MRTFADWMGQNILSYYGFLNKGMYDHFILNRYENDMCSVKSEDSEELSSTDVPAIANIKPRKTKFAPQAFHNCTFCGKWYRSKTSLGLHRRLECGKEPAFQCPFCPLKTHQKGNLQVHIRKKHTNESAEVNRMSSNSLKNKNPILAQELGMTNASGKVNAQQLGINKDICSELTITRTQSSKSTGPSNSTLNKTPNLSHILSQPNKARGITQFPLSVSEINSAASTSFSAPASNNGKIRVRSIANIPPGVTITQNRPLSERLSSDITITPTVTPSITITESFSLSEEHNLENSNEHNSDERSKTLDKKLPELTRILNSQEPVPVPPIPTIVEAFNASISAPSTSSDVENESATIKTEVENEDIPDSTDKNDV
ncbi:zinc finger protein syd-9-like [Macrosteles quadrilineatus]|uniref:zinc finger protein syd-9-like n=1 Tax=Macrosteles quadrilineatus TaxID=74068 RepID=UPI0023E1D023|nr:zinc finger protein syd-9-like [Macrosteles quadrilineatus]